MVPLCFSTGFDTGHNPSQGRATQSLLGSSVSIMFVSTCGVTLEAGSLESGGLGSSVSILFVSAFGVILGARIFGARGLGLRLSLDWILDVPAFGVLLRVPRADLGFSLSFIVAG